MSTIGNSLSSGQAPLLQEVSVAVLAMSLRSTRATADQIQTLIDTAQNVAQVVTDQSLANKVDLLT